MDPSVWRLSGAGSQLNIFLLSTSPAPPFGYLSGARARRSPQRQLSWSTLKAPPAERKRKTLRSRAGSCPPLGRGVGKARWGLGSQHACGGYLTARPGEIKKRETTQEARNICQNGTEALSLKRRGSKR